MWTRQFGSSADDKVYVDDVRKLIYQTNDNGTYVGLESIKNVSSFRSMANGVTKTGFTDEQLSSMLSDGVNYVNDDMSGDLMLMVSS